MFEVESNHKAIQTIMGHAEISTTLDIYTHITEDTLKNSVQNMSAKSNFSDKKNWNAQGICAFQLHIVSY